MAWIKVKVRGQPFLVNGDTVLAFTEKQTPSGKKLVIALINGTTIEVDGTEWTLEALESIIGEVHDLTQKPSPLFTPFEFTQLTNLSELTSLSELFGPTEEGGEENEGSED